MSTWFLDGLARGGDAEALRVGSRSLSYRQLHERALAIAADLVGVAARRVGVLAARSEQAYAGLLAAAYAGATLVPLNPAFPAERTRQMIAAAGVDALVVDEAGRAAYAGIAEDIPTVAVIGEPVGEPLGEPRPAGPEDIAYIMFTSGSSGIPKGVPIRHRNVDAYLRFVHARYDFTAEDVFSQTFDLTFDPALFDLFAAWGSGAAVVSVPPHAYSALPRFVARNGITVWYSAPSVISLCRKTTGLGSGSFPSLRWSLFCAEPLLAEDVADWLAAAPNSTVENLYGPTELTVTCLAHRWDPGSSPRQCVNGIAPIGVLNPGLSYLLHEPEGAPGAEVGELCVTGEQMFDGYLDPADDDGRFLVGDDQRWYRTGDLVRRVGPAELTWIGRVDHQVKIRGVRVELSEVEAALRGLDGVQDAVAIAASGELVVFCTGLVRPAAELAGELTSLLPAALIPRRFTFLDDFPLNANRKVDRLALARLAEEALSAGVAR